jgi:oligopeptide transport system ATP-binding protein
MSLLNVKNLTTRFHTRDGVINAVEDVSFEVEQGEITAIIGESGSGKSIACNSLLGLIPRPPGKIEGGTALFEGQDLLQLSEKELRKLRGSEIAMVFQDPMTSLNPYLTIGEQLIEPLLQHQNMSRADAMARAIELLEEVGITRAAERFRSFPHEFSGGMRQRVMIAMALINEPKLLIADEPTTALDVTIQAQILRLIAELQSRRNIGVIFISHDLSVVADIATRIIVMKDGNVVEHGSRDEIFRNPQHPYTRELLDAVPAGHKDHNAPEDTVLLEVDHLSTWFRSPSKGGETVKACDDLTFNIRRGEILGLVGESGSGKSTCGRSILRLVEPRSGQVRFDGTDLGSLASGEMKRMRRRMQMIFQDPYASLNPRMTIFDTLAEPLLLHRICGRKEVEGGVLKLMDDVGLARRYVRKYPHEFSGGQRQRIAIGRAIATRPEFIVADEPVSALDVTIQAQVLDLIVNLVDEYDLTMLFVSHDLAVVRYIADRILVMHLGQIVETGSAEDVFDRPQHDYTRKLMNAIPGKSLLESGAAAS